MAIYQYLLNSKTWLTCLLLVVVTHSYAQKTDKVYFENGDYLLGELMSLEHGKLVLDSEYAGKVNLQWDEVISVKTDKSYILQTEDGNFYEGTFLFENPETITIVTEDTTFLTTRKDIVRLALYKNRFLQRFKGSLGLGLDYSTGSDVFQINLFTELAYIGPKYRSSISFGNLFTNILTDSTKYTKRDLSLFGLRYFGRSWLVSGEYKFEQNSELGFDSRNTITASGGKNLLQSQNTDMLVTLGVSYNREIYTTDENVKEGSNNVELPMMAQFEAFKSDTPELTTKLAFTYFPNLTDLGRHRFNSSIKFSIQVFSDFWLSIEFYDNYDNRIPSTGKKSNDYGVLTTVSYSFGK